MKVVKRMKTKCNGERRETCSNTTAVKQDRKRHDTLHTVGLSVFVFETALHPSDSLERRSFDVCWKLKQQDVRANPSLNPGSWLLAAG